MVIGKRQGTIITDKEARPEVRLLTTTPLGRIDYKALEMPLGGALVSNAINSRCSASVHYLNDAKLDVPQPYNFDTCPSTCIR